MLFHTYNSNKKIIKRFLGICSGSNRILTGLEGAIGTRVELDQGPSAFGWENYFCLNVAHLMGATSRPDRSHGVE